MRTPRAVVLLAPLLLAGCLDDALYLPDGRSRADLARPHDLAGVDLTGRDLAGIDRPQGDQVDAWPGGSQVRGSPTEAPFDFVTWGRSPAIDGDALSAEIWHRTGSPATPYTVALGDTNYLLCEVCVL